MNARAIGVGFCLALIATAGACGQASAALVADSGFRPAKDGYSFPNYVNSRKVSNLGVDEVRRLFGNARLRPSHLLQSVQQTHGMDRRYVGGPRAWDDAWRSSTTGRIGTGTKLNWMSIRVATSS